MDRIRTVTYDLKLIENEYRSVINQSRNQRKDHKGVIKVAAVKPLHVESITTDASRTMDVL